METQVTLWYQRDPHDYNGVFMYNHLEDEWNIHERPTVISQQQHWWNDRYWRKEFGYLKNGVVTHGTV